MCPDNVCLHSPVKGSQTFAVRSQEAVRTEVPSVENTADSTPRVCPDNVCLHSPVEPFQILAVQSMELVSILGTTFITRVSVTPSVMRHCDNVARGLQESKDCWSSNKETKQVSHDSASQTADQRSARVAHEFSASVWGSSPANFCA